MATTRRSLWLVAGGLSGASSVVAGSLGSHSLPKRVDDKHYLKLWQTAVDYHQFHSVALCLCSFVVQPWANVAGGLFLGGIAMFSGSLYTIAWTQERNSFTKLAPVGGTSLILGWLALAISKIPK